MEKEYIGKLKLILSDLIDLSSIEIEDNTLLGEGGIGLDSLMFLKLITEVEKTFRITIEDDYWDYNRMSTLNQIAKYISDAQGS